ncbi:hypothetical protein H634G_00988 [Metarhizium anisopliae BRIP 53293]|uniref:Uncharacterized protein n=1 Tax=Metarhizium anisopliae BRIP 53293 TaxID=1291518 RepID=A0A0D9PG04_METAN|nr:hypothetical protein H634G_00988 [Metarhizium anisopliae BRIP 53293]KJK94388.1 hypothetical protein H633G_01769 [Metarhizium anisopliae BRIP 53284]
MPANKTQGSQVALHAIPSEATLVDVSQSQDTSKANSIPSDSKTGFRSTGSWSRKDPYYVSWEARVFAAVNK